MISRKPSSASIAASTVCERITPPEKVSRPSSTPRDASSMIRTLRRWSISATTRRIALAPMSSTPISSVAGVDESGIEGFAGGEVGMLPCGGASM
jgi:hypothetical protein